jgi:uncharacterized repeat protein (TIGR04138 family)
VHRNLPYDPLKDFIPVTQTTLSPLLLMVGTATPVRSVKEYIALARSKPGGVTYASSGPGGSGHLAGALFEHVAGVDLLHIPYRGAPPALIDLVAGQVQSMFGTMLAAVPHVRSGKIRAIAVTGPRRSEAVPEVLTFAESGLPAYDASSWNGIMVPAGTPMPIVDPKHPLFQLLKQDQRYTLEAYLFILEALSFAQESLGLGQEPALEEMESLRSGEAEPAPKPRSRGGKSRRRQAEQHVSGQQLCEAVSQLYKQGAPFAVSEVRVVLSCIFKVGKEVVRLLGSF